MKKINLIIALALIILSSCKKNLPDVGGTSAKGMANEWWVTLVLNGADLIGTHVKLATYNTSSNGNELWVDDLKNGYGFKVKANADFKNLTFTVTDSNNEYYDPAHPANFPKTVTLSNSKILLGVGRSKSGNVVDSIYMEAKFSDDPADTFIISGHARTRFVEDEY